MAKFGDYYLAGSENLEELKRLHDSVVYHKDNVFTNRHINDVLLNDGHAPEGERPNSFYDVYDSIFLRSRTSIHLNFLETMVDIATSPQLTVVNQREKGIVSPEGKGVLYPNDVSVEVGFETPQGYDSGFIEKLQRKWFEESEVVEDIRRFQSILSGAFEEFNLKFILYRMDRSLRLNIPEDFGERYNIQEKIVSVFGGEYGGRGKRLGALDNAYYNRGKQLFGQAGKYWDKLGKRILGKYLFFLLRKMKRL
jgi:hypothetical protein